MKVLVTGAAGRLGRSVVIGLGAAGHEVVAADRDELGGEAAARAAAVRALDLGDEAAVDALFAEERPEAVVHLAAIAVPFSAPEREILLTNTGLGYTVPAAALRHGAGRVLAASSPTVVGYGHPSWRAGSAPIDETHPLSPWNAYALSKLVIEQEIAHFGRLAGSEGTVFGAFRPCYVISPEEWAGAPTQQGHTVAERLEDPSLAAVSLFNYLDARDAADFTVSWIEASGALPQGEVFFVGAADALAARPVAELWRRYAPALGEAAEALVGDAPVFSIAKAERLLGWRPQRSWRTELTSPLPAVTTPVPTPTPIPDASTP